MGEDFPYRGDRQPPLLPRRIVVDPRKFSEYVLDPDKAFGKDNIFIARFGYRPRSEEDALALSDLYIEQAKVKLAAGDYEIDRQDEHGRRYVLGIELGGRQLRSIWILRSNDEFALVTPFSGFADLRRREP